MIFKCRICGKQFRNRSGLNTHLAIVHTVAENCISTYICSDKEECGEWVCPLCNLDYAKKDGLRRHVKKIHKAEEAERILETATPARLIGQSLEDFKTEFAEFQKGVIR